MKSYGTRGKAAPHNSTVYEAYIKALGLKQSELNSLAARGLTGKHIKAAQYATKNNNKSKDTVTALAKISGLNLDGVPGFFIDDKTGQWTNSGVAGIVIPVRDWEGNISSILIRNSGAKANPETGKITNKYIAFSSAGKTKGGRVFQTTHCPVVKGLPKEISGSAIRVTEGVLKADVATALDDKYCIGIQGLNVSEDFDIVLTELECSEIFIALDQGEDENIDIIRARAQLIEKSRAFGLEMHVEVWDVKYGKGIDDVLASGHRDKIRLASKEEIEAYLEKANRKDPENGDWIYIISTERFINKHNFQELKKSQFCDKFQLEKVENINKLIAGGFPQIDKQTFYPGADMMLQEDGLSCLNMWRDPKISGSKGDVKRFLDHVAYILPDENEASLFIDYLAFQVQNPGVKMQWCAIMQGDEGIGKSWFGFIMKQMLGHWNVSTPNNEMLAENYTDWMKHCSFVLIEEIMMRGRLDLMNKLKPMITQDDVQIREMHKAAYMQPNRCNFLMFTNHVDALILMQSDRRYLVLFSNALFKSDEYYQDLWDWIKTPEAVAGMYDFFMRRDLSKMKPFGRAPMTEAKKSLIEISKSPLQEWIQAGISERTWPFNQQLVSIRHLKDKRICPNGFEKISDFKWAEALKMAGASKYPKRISTGDSLLHVWACYGAGIIMNLEPEAVAKLYDKSSLMVEPGNPLIDRRDM